MGKVWWWEHRSLGQGCFLRWGGLSHFSVAFYRSIQEPAGDISVDWWTAEQTGNDWTESRLREQDVPIAVLTWLKVAFILKSKFSRSLGCFCGVLSWQKTFKDNLSRTETMWWMLKSFRLLTDYLSDSHQDMRRHVKRLTPTIDPHLLHWWTPSWNSRSCCYKRRRRWQAGCYWRNVLCCGRISVAGFPWRAASQ